MLALIANWLTPASLFLFLNLIIGTIAVASRFGSHNKPQHINPPPLARAPSLIDRVKSINFYSYKYTAESETTTNWTDQPQLERAPSLLERFKSINLSGYYGSAAGTKFSSEHDSVQYAGHESESEPAAVLQRAPSLLERVKSIKLSLFYIADPEKEPGLDAGHGSSSDVHAEHQMWRSKTEYKESPKKRGKMKKWASEKAVEADAAVQEREEEVEKRRPATTRVERTVSIGDEGVDAKADDFINRFKQQLKLQRLDSLLRYKAKGKPNVRI